MSLTILDSDPEPFYCKDGGSYIRVPKEAKDFVRGNSDLTQYVTGRSGDSEDISENIRNRDLLLDLVSVAQSLGHLPDKEEIERHSNYSADRFREKFGGLFEACQKAGIVPDSVTKEDYTAAKEEKEHESQTEEESKSDPDPDPDPESSPSGSSKAELIEELQWVDKGVDGIPYPSDMNKEGAFTAHTYQEVFGSWYDALDAAGVDKEQELLKDMQRVADKVGEDLTAPEMNEHGRYSSNMAAQCFGSWGDAKERFQEWSSEQEGRDDDSSEKFENMVNDRLDDILG